MPSRARLPACLPHGALHSGSLALSKAYELSFTRATSSRLTRSQVNSSKTLHCGGTFCRVIKVFCHHDNRTSLNALLTEHEKTPFHLQIGGGDQVYSDGVMNLPSFMLWGCLPNLADKISVFPSNELRSDIDDWYLKSSGIMVNYLQIKTGTSATIVECMALGHSKK